jgi:DNA invertase Pin-like site-specific DNA recombinase
VIRRGPARVDALRAALYARVSLDDGRQDPENQLQALREYARSKGYLVQEFVDRASARDLAHRPQWRRLLAGAHRGQYDLVIVWKLDRAFRSSLEALRGLEELNHEGIGFVCVTQPIDTTSPTGRLLFAILAAIAETERELISERTRAGMARARAAGKSVGRPRGSRDRGPRRRRPQRAPVLTF